jgi:hypothetical protein
MILSPLPAHQRKRKFHLFHGELMDEDDFEEDETQEEVFEDDFVPDEVPEEQSDELLVAEVAQEPTPL